MVYFPKEAAVKKETLKLHVGKTEKCKRYLDTTCLLVMLKGFFFIF